MVVETRPGKGPCGRGGLSPVSVGSDGAVGGSPGLPGAAALLQTAVVGAACACAQSLNGVRLSATPGTVTYTGVGDHFLLQGIFPTQGLKPSLPYWQANSSPLRHLGSP